MSFPENLDTISTIICFLLLFLIVSVMYMKNKGTENIIRKVVKGTSASAHWNSVGWSFTRDTEYLKHLIDTYSDRSFQLEQLAASIKFGLNKPSIIKDEDLNDIVSNITVEVWQQLGDNYKELLSYYMGGNEQIQVYIVNEVHRIISSKVNKFNEMSVRSRFHKRNSKIKQD